MIVSKIEWSGPALKHINWLQLNSSHPTRIHHVPKSSRVAILSATRTRIVWMATKLFSSYRSTPDPDNSSEWAWNLIAKQRRVRSLARPLASWRQSFKTSFKSVSAVGRKAIFFWTYACTVRCVVLPGELFGSEDKINHLDGLTYDAATADAFHPSIGAITRLSRIERMKRPTDR